MTATPASPWLAIALLIDIPNSHAEGRLPVTGELVDVHEHWFILYRLIGVPEFELGKGQHCPPEKLAIKSKHDRVPLQRSLDTVSNLA